MATPTHSAIAHPSNAFLEGYVQQFLYTFRYFCTPRDFLHFLLDRISSTSSRYPHPGLPGPEGQGKRLWDVLAGLTQEIHI